MKKELRLKIFDSSKDIKFPNQNLDVWISQIFYDELIKQNNKADSEPIYITVTSKEVLKPFTFHSILQVLNSNSNLPITNVYVSKDISHKDWLMEDDTRVSLTIINENELIVAEVVTVKLTSKEVENWSDDEVKFASTNYKALNRITYKSQKVWINPATKKATLGEVINVIPSSNKQFNTPFLLSENTKIIFEGLAEEQQTVIDFSKIGGLTTTINKLREIIQIPLQFPDLLNRFDIKPPKGLLLYGPPGNGKTMIAKAVSYSMGAKFISIEGPELMSKYVGVAESQLRQKFEEAEKLGDCVIFIDEIDSIAGNREKTTAEHNISIVATLLNLMDGMKSRSRVFVIGATNRLNAVDPALRRPGRFDLEFEVPIPNQKARLDILSKYISTNGTDIIDNSVNESLIKLLSDLTNGYSGADIFSLYRESTMNTIREHLKIDEKTGKIFLKGKPTDIKLSERHFLSAIRNITPTSLRGIETIKSFVPWESIIGLNEQKKKLVDVNNFLHSNNPNLISNQRPSFLNIVFKGVIGSGRKTLINSFAYKYNYEILFLDVFSFSSNESWLSELEETFIKAKQIAPSIIYISNLQFLKNADLIIRKIQVEISKLSIRNKIILIAEIDTSKEIPTNLVQHKSFSFEITFEEILSNNFLSDIFNKYNRFGYRKSFDEFKIEFSQKSIGKIITELNDNYYFYS